MTVPFYFCGLIAHGIYITTICEEYLRLARILTATYRESRNLHFACAPPIWQGFTAAGVQEQRETSAAETGSEPEAGRKQALAPRLFDKELDNQHEEPLLLAQLAAAQLQGLLLESGGAQHLQVVPPPPSCRRL